MDQKNTIVKCTAHPDCLFCHNGICDNYVINIGADGKCECYVETATSEHNCDFSCKHAIKLKNWDVKTNTTEIKLWCDLEGQCPELPLICCCWEEKNEV